jgi:YegS/Rv2252/BmrU family lipid kinase
LRPREEGRPIVRVDVIVNPVSGRFGGRAQRVARACADAEEILVRLGARARLHVTERPGHAAELSRHAVASGTERVIAWGGDGTVNEVATALAFSAVPLAVVPSGSGNGLAREIGVPFDVGRALRIAVEGQARHVDVGEIAGRRFVNVAGIGFDAKVARAFDTGRRGRRGLSTYVRLTLREFLRYAPRACRVLAGGEAIDTRPLLVAIANSAQYGNGARIAPAARMDDGLLDLVVVEATRPLRDILRARRLFTGTIERDRGARVRRVTSLRIESDAPLPAHVDGQPFEGGPMMDATVHPAALRVVYPPS